MVPGEVGKAEEVTLMDRVAHEAQRSQIREAAAPACMPPSRGCSDEIIFLINLDNSLLIHGSVCINTELFFPSLFLFKNPSAFHTFQGGELGA